MELNSGVISARPTMQLEQWANFAEVAGSGYPDPGSGWS
jgi:hypothetical protein